MNQWGASMEKEERIEAPSSPADADRRTATLARLLALRASSLPSALDQAADLVAEALRADKVDAFIPEESGAVLVAVGVSNTPMGRKQRAIGMDRLPLANGGRTVEVFRTGIPFRDGHVECDAGELSGMREGLGVRSTIAVPLPVGQGRRGVLQVTSAQPERFSEQDLHFLGAVADWVGLVADQALLVERLTHEAAERARQLTARDLITILAHDLNNYLTPLQARLDLMRRRAAREDRERDVADAREALVAVARLGQLIRNLLDAGRLEGGIFTLALQPANLADLVKDTAALWRSPSTPVEVRAPDELVAQADPPRLQQVLENILANAVRYSPPRRPHRGHLGHREQ